jgi:hypothetical protein
VPKETWRHIDDALRLGQRGLRGGRTLTRLLTERRGRRTRCYPPPLAEAEILAWARAYRRRTGAWPSAGSGPVPESLGETWRAVDEALRQGARGLRGGTSLARLLAERQGARNRTSLPPLTAEQVLAWADVQRQRTGAWPSEGSGPVVGAPGETWRGVNLALSGGYRGLPGGSSLARLLAQQRGARNRAALPPLSAGRVRAWAREHYRRTGSRPTAASGPVAEAPGETWRGLDEALRRGYRGLPGGSSLAALWRGQRGAAGRAKAPR